MGEKIAKVFSIYKRILRKNAQSEPPTTGVRWRQPARATATSRSARAFAECFTALPVQLASPRSIQRFVFVHEEGVVACLDSSPGLPRSRTRRRRGLTGSDPPAKHMDVVGSRAGRHRREKLVVSSGSHDRWPADKNTSAPPAHRPGDAAVFPARMSRRIRREKTSLPDPLAAIAHDARFPLPHAHRTISRNASHPLFNFPRRARNRAALSRNLTALSRNLTARETAGPLARPRRSRNRAPTREPANPRDRAARETATAPRDHGFACSPSAR